MIPIDLDVNGVQLHRGDWVVPSDAMKLIDPALQQVGTGQVEHIFTTGLSTGIHVRFPSASHHANNGHALRKVSPPPL